jgi:class 3 adenylate cyclase
MVELPGEMHCCWDAREWADALDVVEEFLTGAPAASTDTDRQLATVLFTDIVDSTRAATEVGDRVWRDILDRHDSASRRIVERYGGRVIKHTGDGTLGTFDSPARAVYCAQTIRDTLAQERIDIRAGIHTGEIERRDDDISGIAVHIAARIAALAAPAEILTSRTVHDLVAGSDLHFEDRGLHRLKGIETEWQVYAATTPNGP